MSLIKHIAQLFNEPFLSDFEFICTETNTRYPAHKIVLSQLPFFHLYFTTNVGGSVQEKKEMNIPYPWIFEVGIRYLYCENYDLNKIPVEEFVEGYKLLEMWEHPLTKKHPLIDGLFGRYYAAKKSTLIENEWEFVCSRGPEYENEVIQYFDGHRIDLPKNFLDHPLFKKFDSHYKAYLYFQWGMDEEILMLSVSHNLKADACIRLGRANDILKIIDPFYYRGYFFRNLDKFNISAAQKLLIETERNSFGIISFDPLILTSTEYIGLITGKSKVHHAIIVAIEKNMVVHVEDQLMVIDSNYDSSDYDINDIWYENIKTDSLISGREYSIAFGKKDDTFPKRGSDVYMIKAVH